MEDTIFFKPKGPFSLNKLIDAGVLYRSLLSNDELT